jgi:CRISPR-associated protein (TIGR02710 family)
MTRVLLVTVGGSPDPIIFSVQAVRREQPSSPLDVVFICSVDPCPRPSLVQVIGEGFPCEHYLPGGQKELGANLLVQLGITDYNPERHLIGLPDPDDLADAYQRIRDHIQMLRSGDSSVEIRGDYTGGTKSMSTALAMVCVQLGIDVGVVSGPRTNLEKIDQSETTRLMEIGPLQAAYRLQTQLKQVLGLHNYGEATHLVDRFLQVYGNNITTNAAIKAKELWLLLQALDTWDRFQWNQALEQAKKTSLPEQCSKLMNWWQRVVMARDCLDGKQLDQGAGITGYELVQDLILSAERKAAIGSYDDAVARLYRSLELLAETYIHLEHKLKRTNRRDVRGFIVYRSEDDAQVTGPRDRGVLNLYLWLRGYEKTLRHWDGLGALFHVNRAQFDSLLTARNKSLLAHGLKPLSEDRWRELHRNTLLFVDGLLVAPGFCHHPAAEQLPGSSLLALPAAQQLFGLSP